MLYVVDVLATEDGDISNKFGVHLQAAISATWLFCAAIPALLAFKRAAESLEKLMDATREELPDTMAAVRLSGMEISDLTMELSDLGQEITQGVRSSTRAVRLAEERLRRLTNMKPIVSLQAVVPTTAQIAEPVLARTARGMREGIVKGRGILQMLFALTRYSKMLLNYFSSRSKA
ncbi:transmembrane protein [Perilla frutescens var. hirtella]|uniref:Transmembrane protein n=1 Tax=Perilla frutescens var. hirtella TaxID=608512 RepID=A0AAD4JIX6_PERFH|nr:transmembrane protein [Perilla frutescens var. hirtella]